MSFQEFFVDIRFELRMYPVVKSENTEYVIGLQNAETRLNVDLRRLMSVFSDGAWETPEEALQAVAERIKKAVDAVDPVDGITTD